MLTLQDFEKVNLYSLAFMFFNLTDETEDYYEFKSAYRSSKHAAIELDEKVGNNNNIFMEKLTGLSFKKEQYGNGFSHAIRLEKSKKIQTKDDLYHVLNKFIQRKRAEVDDDDFNDTINLMCFIPRGSIDPATNFIAIDINRNNVTINYLKLLMDLIISTVDSKQLNLNFRELQPEFVEGISKRNSQLRVNLKWFTYNYKQAIKEINQYKYNIIDNKKNEISLKNIKESYSSKFIERYVFYMDVIVNELNKNRGILSAQAMKKQVAMLRNELEFNEETEQSDRNRRRQDIVSLAKFTLEDICYSCHHEHNLEDRTFKYKDSDMWYLEIHHVISFSSNNSGDISPNLVKLCPSCHAGLRKNRAEPSYQKRIIKNILTNSPDAKDYVSNFLSDSSDMDDMISYVFNHLS